MYWESDKYLRRERSTERRNAENAKIETLTDEQHDTLAELSRIRHEIHSETEALFYDESSNHRRYWDYIDGVEGTSGIDQMLKEAGLPEMGLLVDGAEYPYYSDWEMTHDSMEDALTDSRDMAEDVNNKIEKYLRTIDSEHGTRYAPTGIARLYR